MFAARFPNGAIAVGALERTMPGRAWYMPRAAVILDVEDSQGPFGVFGEYERLTLHFAKPQHGRRMFAQDLAGDKPIDISSQVELEGTAIRSRGFAASRKLTTDAAT